MSSSRMKRLLRELNDIRGGNESKRRRNISGSDDEDVKAPPGFLSDYGPPVNIYNSGTGKKPAELFRKDLISAMKLADSEQLDPKEYVVITDQWKPEWERGVQVPVNADSLPQPNVRILDTRKMKGNFRLPKKLIRSTHNESFCSDIHTLANVATKAEKVCRYDMDMLDDQWLKAFNEERFLMGLPLIEEDTFETVIEEFEIESYTKIQSIIQSEQGYGIEYDENVICDVCRSPDSEEGNEMVFCDLCDICVHQACYGITEIPEGSWLCKPCSLQTEPQCIFCPNRGGALKPVKNESTWSHVSCALWIPEVSIGVVEKMEPITKINQIPSSRWSLLCSQCKEKTGACIQCSVKTCKTAYHVTCAFKDCLQMKAVLVGNENGADGVKLRSYCAKHSQKKEKECPLSDSDSDCETNRKIVTTKYSMSEEKSNARNARLRQLETEFYKYIDISEVAETVQVDKNVVDFLYQYWKLKRLANFLKPLLRPKEVETDMLNKLQEDSLYEKMKMFVHLRQDLERVRNLSYMVTRREKLSRSLLKSREDVFNKQAKILSSETFLLTERERRSIIHANHTDNVYDVLYSSLSDRTKHRHVSSILSILSHPSRTAKVRKTRRAIEPNPYAKKYAVSRLINRTKRQSEYGDFDSPQTAEIGAEGHSELIQPIIGVELDYDDTSLAMIPISVDKSSVNVERPEDEENELQNDREVESVIKSEFKSETTLDSPVKSLKDKNLPYGSKSKCSMTENNSTLSTKKEAVKRDKLPSRRRFSKKYRRQRSSENSLSRERLCEVNAKIREAIFSNSLSRKSSVLSGYKIPKKQSASSILLKPNKIPEDSVGNVEETKECKPVNDVGARPLVLKLRKDPDFPPESSRWKSESEMSVESSPMHIIHSESSSEATRLTRQSVSKNCVVNHPDDSSCYPLRTRQSDASKSDDQFTALPL